MFVSALDHIWWREPDLFSEKKMILIYAILNMGVLIGTRVCEPDFFLQKKRSWSYSQYGGVCWRQGGVNLIFSSYEKVMIIYGGLSTWCFSEERNDDYICNKLGLSCAKLGFSCASQLSFDGRQFNSVNWTLESVEALNQLKPLANWTL